MNAPGSPVPSGAAPRGPAPLQGPSGTAPARRAGTAADGAAFKALLEDLERRAGALEQRSRSELQSEDLPEAVDEARASMNAALELSTGLLEAWRQARTQDGGTPPTSGA